MSILFYQDILEQFRNEIDLENVITEDSAAQSTDETSSEYEFINRYLLYEKINSLSYKLQKISAFDQKSQDLLYFIRIILTFFELLTYNQLKIILDKLLVQFNGLSNTNPTPNGERGDIA